MKSEKAPGFSTAPSTPPMYQAGSAPPVIQEKGDLLSPDTMEEAQPLLWKGIEDNNPARVSSALANLSRKDCLRLLHQPKTPVAEGAPAFRPTPGLPLCVAAAAGSEAAMQALISAGARADIGDTFREGVPLTALYWAAAKGQRGPMDLLHNVEGLSLDQAELALESAAQVETVKWCREHNFKPEAFHKAVMTAVTNEAITSLRNLVTIGKAPVNFLVPDGTSTTPLLCYAIKQGKKSAASELVDLKADPDGMKGTAFDEQPLTLAMNRCKADPAYVTLVIKLLRANATTDPAKHLELAMSQGAQSSTLFVELLRVGDVAPETVAQAVDLLASANEAKLSRVAQILRDLRTMLEHGVKWKDSESKEGKSPLVARARERILAAFDDDDDTIGWLPPGAAMLSAAGSDRSSDRNAVKALGNKVSSKLGFGRSKDSDAASGVLVTTKAPKKKLFG